MTVILAVVWTGAFVATHIPAGKIPPTGTSDVVLHLIGYAVLGMVLLMTLSCRGVSRARAGAVAGVVLPLYAAFDEITQPLVNRSASTVDWAFDCLGAAVAMVAWWSLLALARPRLRRGARPAE